MLNIISNDCTAAFLYSELLNVEYQSVFNPTWMSSDNFLKLIENYDLIDFNKFVVEGNSVHIDDTVTAVYNNYVEVSDIAYPCVTFDHEKLLVPDLKQFIIERYTERLRRSILNNNDVVFVFNETSDTSYEDILDFLNMETPYKKILYTSHEDLIMYSDVDTMIEIVDDNCITGQSYIDCAETVHKLLF